jgi:NAD-dependent dihydropyrimidine dehydrogenase PreA subunit
VDSYDNVRNIVKNTKKSIGVITCVCREGKDLLEESCKHSDIRETCLIFEDIASSAIDSGGAREISKEETLSILDKAEDAGFVLQPENTQKPNFICCCCGDCCNVLTTVKKFPKPAEYYHSNYFSKVDSGKCDQCWDCIEICPMDALEMEDDAPSVDLDRCIGCGVCVSKCKSGAYGLIAKDTKHTPPKDSEAMYKRILVERIGIGGMLKTLPKMIFHQKI